MNRFKSIKNVTIAAVLTTALGSGMVMPLAAHASEAGRRNTTYALGALTAVLAAKQQWIPAAVAGVGTVIAEQNLQNEIDNRNQQYDQWNYRGSQSYNGRDNYGRDNYNGRFDRDDVRFDRDRDHDRDRGFDRDRGHDNDRGHDRDRGHDNDHSDRGNHNDRR